ncbi:cation efflux protein [Mycena rebaudengoi]|nr:cation efflux protein [Mycena rebaudengoi]
MPAPDAKTRSSISLSPRVFSTSIPPKHLPRIFLNGVFYASSLHAGKGLLAFDVGVFWVVMRVLACAGFGVLVWEGRTGQVAKRKSIEWSVLATASLLVFVQQACLFTALYRLPSTRVVLFTHFSTLWLNALWTTSAPRKTIAVALAWVLSIASDTQFSSDNLWRFMPGYGALLIHSLTSSALDQTIGILAPSLGSTFTIAASTLGACGFALPFYVFRTVVLDFPATPILPLISLAAIPFLAFSLLFFAPITARSLSHLSFTPQHFTLAYPSTAVFAGLFGSLAFAQFPTWTDAAVAILLYLAPRTPTSRLIRSYLKTILSNPESRKIFYFLMLNMAYMLVQMLYGVWTNSLGLISDAIHMAFDCMAIGVGLFASVMATWEPNERFTYGYGRIETLSGFANGIFLILISIFIVFEAIQRLLDPPEMNTSQLLLVSSLGLAVNLFGMFAMGGHHHGGHSHSHGHSHGGHSQSHSEHSSGSLHDEGHGHSHSSGHSHSHSPPPSPMVPFPQSPLQSHSHSHSPPSAPSHAHSHSPPLEQTHSHSHSPPHSPPGDHSHSHSSHAHSHSPPPAEHSHGLAPHLNHSHSNGPTSPIQSGHTHGEPRSPLQNGHSHAEPHLASPVNNFKRPAALLQVNSKLASSALTEIGPTPITPNYHFDDHAPNLSHAHASTHEGHSHNMRGVFLHVMADTLGSVGVIISTLLIQFYGWTGFDPIASLFIAILIAASVVPLVMDTGRVLCLDISEREVSIDKALAELASIEGLASFTAPRFWPKDSSSLVGSIHIQLAPSASSFDPSGPHSNQRRTYANLDRVVERVDSLLRQRISGLAELTIQVDETKPGYT